MTSSAAILNFPMRYSRGRNFCPILFKFGYDVVMGNPVSAIENQQNRSVTFGFIKNRAFEFSRISPKIAAKITTNLDLLNNTNLIIFFRLKKSLLV